MVFSVTYYSELRSAKKVSFYQVKLFVLYNVHTTQ